MSKVEDFKFIEQDNLRLILPSHVAAVSNAAWTTDNLWWRSRVECVKNAETVSQGFGKFFNLGMGPEDLNISAQDILAAIRSGERVTATLKYDGSCLIRSVYKGKVMFRTRGSFSYEFHDRAKEELDVFLEKYPALADPNVLPGYSMFFEWVTPDAQIVVKYDKPELYLIGGVNHGHRHISHLRYVMMEPLSHMANQLGVPMMESREIRSIQDWHHLYQEICDHKEIEGYVIRLHQDQTLVKVKSQSYLTKHGLKSNLSFKSMVEFWLQHEQLDHEGLLAQLEQMYDEEVVAWALPFVMELSVAIDAWNQALAGAKAHAIEKSHWSRKDFAIKMQEVYKNNKGMFGIVMQLYQGKPIDDKAIRNFMKEFSNE